MHICYIIVGDATSPAYFRGLGMGAALLKLGVQVSYIADDTPTNHRPGIFDPRSQIVFVSHPRALSQYRARREAISVLKPDFVVVLSPHPKLFLAVVGKPRVRVLGEWDEPPSSMPASLPRRLMYRWLARWLRHRAVVTVACTRYLQDDLMRKGIPAIYLPHAVYLPDRPDPPSPYSEPTFVYLGNLYDVWDHDIVFLAAKKLADRGVRPRIVVMGDGPDREKWAAFVREHSLTNVELAGFMTGDAMWARLRHAHALLSPFRDTVINKSRCSSKLFAYGQSHRPIISCRVGEVESLLGDLPIYVEPTASAFADAMERMLAQGRLADVDYGMSKHTYAERAPVLLDALRRAKSA